jgi:PAS domain S-box-containing protein
MQPQNLRSTRMPDASSLVSRIGSGTLRVAGQDWSRPVLPAAICFCGSSSVHGSAGPYGCVSALFTDILSVDAVSHLWADHRVASVLFLASTFLLLAFLVRAVLSERKAEKAVRLKEQELLETREIVKKSEDRFSKIFRKGPLAIALTNVQQQQYIDVNETFSRMTGYSREELIGRGVQELKIWVSPEQRNAFIQKIMVEGCLHNMEFQYRRKDGELRIAEVSGELIEISGEPCVLGVAADVTDHRRAEQAFKESEKRFRTMADSAPVLIWMSGREGLYTDFNQAWLQFTGRPLEQEQGEGWIQGIHQEDRPSYLRVYAAAAAAHKSFTAEYRLLRSDGEYRWMLDRGAPRFLENGDFAGYIGCCVDITEERAARAERTQLSGMLLQAQEQERARIARELHDDINQRLALLANAIEGLEHTSAKGNRLMIDELRGLWRLTSEIADDVQHLSHQLHPSKLRNLGLASAVRGLCHEFSLQHHIQTECNVLSVPRDLEDSLSLTLFRVAQEALRNVAKHSEAHHVTLEFSTSSATICLNIVDDGIGFSEFERDNRGLGLVSMRERVRLAGGEFLILSKPGEGTKIEVALPLRLKSAAA